jgi:uncharacterized protein (DUF1684 family)
MDDATRRAHLQEVERWRAARLGRLTAPDGWLSLAGLWWLHPGSNLVGTDPSNDVVLPSGPPVVGTIEVVEGRATWTTHLGSFDPPRWRDEPAVGPLELRSDASDDPTTLSLGAISFLVIERERELGVRVRDRDRPARVGFHGIEHYPVDPRWRVEARFDAYDPPRSAAVPTVLGTTESYVVPGAVVLDLDEVPFRLEALLERPDDDLFLVFGDATSGQETFGGGRYLYTKPPDARGVVIVDFNLAYNPPCVFTRYATCPLPLPQNRLPLRIEAGEKRYGSPDVEDA